MAMLIPLEETRAKLTHKEIAEGMRKRIRPERISFREMLQEGRRL